MATKVRQRKPKAAKTRLDKDESQKQIAIAAIRRLPCDASLAQIADEMKMLHSIEQGLRSSDAGPGVPHDEARRHVMQCVSE
jgi:predicted transcriptional regulator